MLDMEDGKIVFSEVIEESQGFLRGLQNSCELHLAAGEVVVLKVDEQQSCFHKGLLSALFLRLLEIPYDGLVKPSLR